MNSVTDTLTREPVGRPQTCFAFVYSLNLGDLDRAAACFSRDACLITPDATAVYGRDRIRPILAQLIAQRVEVEVRSSTSLAAGDTALASERWVVRSSGPEGSRLEQVFNSTLILKRIEEKWKLAIVAPWGWVRQSGI